MRKTKRIFLLFSLSDNMKIIIIFTYICIFTCKAIEYQQGINPKLIFIHFGTVFETNKIANLKIKINTKTIFERNDWLEKHINKIMDICTKLDENQICESIKSFAVIKNNQFRQQYKGKRFANFINIEMQGNIFDQIAINDIKNSISENRFSLFNQTQLLNETWNMQRKINSQTSNELNDIYDELSNIKNETISIQMNIHLNKIIQSVVLDILRNSEIHDSINNIIRDPFPSDILKIINFNNILNVFKQLNSTIRPEELIANSRELNIYNILTLSKLKSNMDKNLLIIDIEIPITISSWKIFKIYPTIFKRGSELIEISNISKYFLENDQNDHLPFSINELSQCISTTWDTFCCTINKSRMPLESCEADVRYQDKLNKCQTRLSIDKQKIIKINESMIYLNNFAYQRVFWGCFNFERMLEFNDSVWINSLPGCHIRIRNKMFIIPKETDQLLEPSFILNSSDLIHLKHDFQIQIYNGTDVERKFTDQIAEIENKLEYLSNRTSKEIGDPNKSMSSIFRNIKWTITPFGFLSYTTLITIIVILAVIIYCMRK